MANGRKVKIMTPNTATKIPVQRSLFDLKTMDVVTLKKEIDFTPVKEVREAVERLGGNTDKLIEVINRGLRAELANQAANDNSIPWMVEDENGQDVPFDGTPADEKAVNTLILSLAKSVFGYNKDMPIEDRRKAKEDAIEMIRNTPRIREGLQKQASKSLETSPE